VRFEEHRLDDARIAVVAFGTAARLAKTAIAAARAEGVDVGLLRPITLWPFPEDALRALAERVDAILVVEMNAGQMLEDVQRIVGAACRCASSAAPAASCRCPRRSKSDPRPGARAREAPRPRPRAARRPRRCPHDRPRAPNPPDARLRLPRRAHHVPTHYCPGCTHGIAHRLIAEVIDEMGVRERTIGVASVGCSVFAYRYFDVDFAQAAHGRAPAMATGIKRVRPTSSCSPTRATATSPRSAPPRSCTPPCAARTSPSSSSTTPSTA
jgi:TPP-dependent indolepyruvate ferredoxin oxidoreductase alpha subunit